MTEPGGKQTELRALLRGPPRYAAVSPWRSVPALVVTAFACLAPMFAVGIAALVAASLGVPQASVDGAAQSMASLAEPLGLAAAAGSQLLSLAIIWIAAGSAGARSDVLRLSPPWPGWSASLAAGLGLVALTGLFELIFYFGLGLDPFADAKWLADGLRSRFWWGTMIVALVLAPVWEELAFRGFLLSALAKSRLGFWPAALVSNTIWTALHFGNSAPGMASVFLAGLVLFWLVWRTGSVRIAIVAHMVANAFALAITYFFAPVS